MNNDYRVLFSFVSRTRIYSFMIVGTLLYEYGNVGSRMRLRESVPFFNIFLYLCAQSMNA